MNQENIVNFISEIRREAEPAFSTERSVVERSVLKAGSASLQLSIDIR